MNVWLSDKIEWLSISNAPVPNGYLGIVVPEQKAKKPVQAINGRCLKCGYRLAWGFIRNPRRFKTL
jgi:hypothetical protein